MAAKIIKPRGTSRRIVGRPSIRKAGLKTSRTTTGDVSRKAA